MIVGFSFKNDEVVVVHPESKVVQAVEPTPEPSPTPIPQSETIKDMLNFIHGEESSHGKNTNPQALHNYCRNIGKWNELGYGGMQSMICFDSEEEGMRKVGDWLDRKLTGFDGDIAKTLCHYNLGGEHINCKYYQRFVGVNIQ